MRRSHQVCKEHVCPDELACRAGTCAQFLKHCTKARLGRWLCSCTRGLLVSSTRQHEQSYLIVCSFYVASVQLQAATLYLRSMLLHNQLHPICKPQQWQSPA